MLLKKGSQGDEVRQLQALLGFEQGEIDGKFGTGTLASVIAFQSTHNLTADGIVGDKTWQALLKAHPDVSDVSVSKNDTTSDVNITPAYLTRKFTRLKSARTPKYLVIHYTAGASSASGRAQRTRDNWQNGDRQASADFVVDDTTLLQANPDIAHCVCWSVGDGKGKYGITNTNSISIEMCSTLQSGTSSSKANHSGWSITPAVWNNTLRLAAHLCHLYNIDINHVVRHYDASRKLCPGVVGWNPERLHNPDGTSSKQYNNESEWHRFQQELAALL